MRDPDLNELRRRARERGRRAESGLPSDEELRRRVSATPPSDRPPQGVAPQGIPRPRARRGSAFAGRLTALAGVALFISAFLGWSRDHSSAFRAPLINLFDVHNFSRSPTLGLVIIVLGIAGVASGLLAMLKGIRPLLALTGLALTIVYAWRILQELHRYRLGFTDLLTYLSAGFYVALVSSLLMLVLRFARAPVTLGRR